MHSVGQAIDALLAGARPLEVTESVALEDACGRVLAEALVSKLDVPPADNSAMDGYALRVADWTGEDTALPVSQRIPAGVVPGALRPGTVARLFTGAEIPPGADAVVMQENTDGGRDAVHILKAPRVGDHIRPRGQDVRRGQVVLAAGSRLRPQDVALAASLGLPVLEVVRRLKVAILSNGRELVEPGDPLAGGQIYNSNRVLLGALMRGWGFEVRDFGIVTDEAGAIRECLARAAQDCDVIVSSGGVSVGEEDHVRAAVGELGSLGLWKVAIKPGKPFAFGQVGETPFLGLPGNPASVLVTALIIARPFLLAMQGVAETGVAPVEVAADFERDPVSRTEYLRVRNGERGLQLFPSQSSGVLLSSVWGDGLALQPAGSAVQRGQDIGFLPYRVLL